MDLSNFLENKNDPAEQHYNQYLPIGKYNVIMIPKNASSTIGVTYCNMNNIELLKPDDDINNYTYKHLATNYSKWTVIHKYVLEATKGKKYVLIYRDPIERLLSAKTVLDPSICTVEKTNEYIETIGKALKKYYHKRSDVFPNLNFHIRPQTGFFSGIDINDIELFIELKDLQNWFKDNNFDAPIVNRTNDLYKEYNEGILNIYRQYFMRYYLNDYEFIENIPEERKYKPQNGKL